MSDVQKKKVAVIGSSSFEDKDMLFRILDKNADKIKVIVSGGVRGADILAQTWAEERGIPYVVFPAKWKDAAGNHDRGAGFRRNREIVKYADTILAFHDGQSGGTQNTIDIANEMGKPLKTFLFTPVKKVDEIEKALSEIGEATS
jgi:predicted Rossmann fold nucleotide-binding protein DprA/Smf involved in DNA uptake